MLTKIVHGLVHEGHAYAGPSDTNIPEYLIEAASDSMMWLIQYFAENNIQPLTRTGEAEPDMLLIQRAVAEGKDVKAFFHYAHDVSWCYGDEVSGHFLKISLLYQNINMFVMRLLDTIQREYPRLFTFDVRSSFIESTIKSMPYNTTTLRGLQYPYGQSARRHFDRGFITAHCGDSGGVLKRYGPGNVSEVISPQSGYLLLFWAVKAAWASKGLLQPVFHGSESSVEVSRSALVQFCHIDIGRLVADATASYLECRKVFDIA